MSRALRVSSLLVLTACVGGSFLACGSRTGLLAPDEEVLDAAGDVRDAGKDAKDSGRDADAREDALPTIDANKDVIKPPPLGCVDAGSTQIYVISSQNELFAFYPPTVSFQKVGNIACPSGGATPFSMGVDRAGIAYSVFTDGKLFRISTANAACQTTTFAPNQLGFQVFGMGYSGDQLTETLYVADSDFNNPSKGLASIDTKTFKLSTVGPFVPQLPRCELTGTGDGHLYAFCLNQGGATGSILAEIDRASGKVVAQNNLKVGDQNNAFAFSFWGGDFYIFTSPSGPSTVTKYDPVLKTETVVASHPSTIVGAGVSTCAPQ